MTTKEIADRLVALCRVGKNLEAIETLLSDDVVSVEAMSGGDMPALMTGKAAVRGKGEWWVANNKVHSAHAEGPFPNGDRFAVIFKYDVTPTSGPMMGRRMKMHEVALYTVENGLITREEFFYDMSGGGEAPAKKRVAKKAARKRVAKKPPVKAKARSTKKAAKKKSRR